MTTLTTVDKGAATRILRDLGFRVRTSGEFAQALRVFQGAYRLGAELGKDRPDGILGPHTSAALLHSEARRRAGQPTASAHLSFAEFACRCGGRYDSCRGVLVLGTLLDALERLRAAHYPHGMSVVSGYRCAEHNRAVGGQPDSQHQWGSACDVERVVRTAAVARLASFSGIGYQASSGLVRHVDVRGLGGAPATTGGTPGRPTLWVYEA